MKEDGGVIMGLGEQECDTVDNKEKKDDSDDDKESKTHPDSPLAGNYVGMECCDPTESGTNSDAGSEGAAVSSTSTVATTTSYLHGDRTTVRRLVARGLRKKQQQNQRRTRPKKEGSMGRRKNGTKNKGKSGLQWSLDVGW